MAAESSDRALLKSNPPLRESGPLLRAVRDAYGVSMVQMAKRLEVDKAGLSRIETGRIGVSLNTADRYAAELGIKPGILPLFLIMRHYGLSVQKVVELWNSKTKLVHKTSSRR